MNATRTFRAFYIAKYGEEAWTQAVKLAGHHRTRATNNHGLTEHFTAMEWLDLCQEYGMKCPLCGHAGSLSPHHIKELRCGGSNTINNILVLCWPCHNHFHQSNMVCTEDWLAGQQALCDLFHIGELVYYNRLKLKSRSVMTIIEIAPPKKASDRHRWQTWGQSNGGGLVIKGYEVVAWDQAIARTRRYGREDGPKSGYSLSDLSLFDETRWFKEQQKLMEQFQVGQWFMFEKEDDIRYGRILELVSPVCDRVKPYVFGASARAEWLTKNKSLAKSQVNLELIELTLCDAPIIRS